MASAKPILAMVDGGVNFRAVIIGYLFTQLLGEKKARSLPRLPAVLHRPPPLSLFRLLRNSHRYLCGGMLLACSIMFPRVLIEVFV